MHIPAENIFLEVPLDSKDALLHFAAQQAEQLGYTKKADDLYDAFCAREKEAATGLQDGFAIPHAKTDVVLKPAVLYITTQTPLTWETFDDKLVSHVFVLMVPTENAGNLHLQMIANLATALIDDDFKQTLSNLTDKQALASYINKQMKGNTP